MLWTSKSSAQCEGTLFALFSMWGALLLSVEPGMHTRAIGIGVLEHNIQHVPCTLEHLLRECYISINLTQKIQHTGIIINRAISCGYKVLVMFFLKTT